jgi:predicted HicB family RNase H-like nuclease
MPYLTQVKQENQKKQRGGYGKIFNLVLPGDHRRAVRIAAAKKDVSMNDYIREAVRMRLVADGEIEKGKDHETT